MPEIKVGQIRKDSLGLYVITYDLTNCAIVYQDGEVREWGERQLECDELIAEYPIWQEAVNSREFNNVAED